MLRDVWRNVMARDKALYDGHAVAAVAATSTSIARKALKLIKVDYEILPHVTDVDEAMKPDAPVLHDDIFTDGVEPKPKKPSNVVNRSRVRPWRCREGLRRGRCRHRAQLQDRSDAPGLYRAPCLPRQCRPRRPGRALGLHPGPLHGAQCLRRSARHGRLQAARHRLGDRRRLRRQDDRVPRAGGAGALAQGRPAGEDGDEPRGSVPRLRPDLQHLASTSRSAATKDGRITAAMPTLRFQGGAFAGSPVDIGAMCAFACYDLENVQAVGYDVVCQPPEAGGLSRARRADGGLRGRKRDRGAGRRRSAWIRIDFRLKNAAQGGHAIAPTARPSARSA